MQILLTHGEVGQAVKDLIAARVLMADSDVVHVTLTEDGATVTILPEGESLPLVDEPEGEDDPITPAGDKPAKKTRRTKAQIEADNKAEEVRQLAAQQAAASDVGNDAVSTETSDAVAQDVETEDAGETTQEASDPGSDEASAEEPEVETTGTATVEDEPTTEAPRAAISLFANLRKPQNG